MTILLLSSASNLEAVCPVSHMLVAEKFVLDALCMFVLLWNVVEALNVLLSMRSVDEEFDDDIVTGEVPMMTKDEQDVAPEHDAVVVPIFKRE